MFPAYIRHLAYVGVLQAGTMFELSGVLDRGTQQLNDCVPNSIA